MSQELITLEQEMWRANREGDANFYAKNLREDALAVSKYGVLDKSLVVPMIGANQNPYLKSDLSEFRILEIDALNALITYRADVTMRPDGQEIIVSVRATSVYNRASGEWLSVFHQQSAL